MSFKPGDSFAFQFTVTDANGALTNADGLPTGGVIRNGVQDAGVGVTVTSVSAGVYKASGTLPGTYVAGDFVQVALNATVGGTSSGGMETLGALDGKRVGDLQDLSSSAVRTQADAALTAYAPARPADVLLTPANKLATDATGRVTVGVNADKSNYTLSAADKTAVANALLDLVNAVDGHTLREIFKGFAAVLLGKVSGAGTNAPVFRDLLDTMDRVSSTTDASGDRTGVILNLSA